VTALVDSSPYGTREPPGLTTAVLAVTRRLPANWLGLRLSMPLRRLAIDRLGDQAVDTGAWGARLRLYPAHNSCEKTTLFTPKLFDPIERAAIAAAINRQRAAGKDFRFVDIGANVGLYSVFVAARAGARARILCIEPQPGIVDRLRFNLALNPGADVTVVPVALGEREGDVELAIDARDSGGTRLTTAPGASGNERVRVPCRPLSAVLRDAGFREIDALKIDIEGAEDAALAPFLREAAPAILPRMVLIEDWGAAWKVDLFALLRERGYREATRSRHNVVFALTPE
jgi:FkbM family methyltransferase